MAHVFISYSTKNTVYARALADYLNHQGFDVWIDDRRIDFGSQWWKEIVKAIRGCGALIVLMTPESEDSEWVQDEVFLAREGKKPWFPVLLRGEKWTIFVRTQYLNLSHLDLESPSIADPRNAEEVLGAAIPATFLEQLALHVTRRPVMGKSVVIAPPPAPPPVETAAAAVPLWAEIQKSGVFALDEAVRLAIKLCREWKRAQDENRPLLPITLDNIIYLGGEAPSIELRETPTQPAAADPAADVWGVGQALYGMLTGTAPQNPLTLPSQLRPEILPALERLVIKSLQTDFFPNPTALQERLEIYLAGAELRQVLEAGERFKVEEAIWQAIRLCTQLEFNPRAALTADQVVLTEIDDQRRARWLPAPSTYPLPSAAEAVADLGSLVYEMLTGCLPEMDQDSAGALLFSEADPWYRLGLDQIIQKACAADPSARYRSVVALRERLHQHLVILQQARELDTLFRAHYPITYVLSWEEERAVNLLRSITELMERPLYRWTLSQGLMRLHGGRYELIRDVPPDNPVAALEYIFAANDNGIFILHDFHPFLRAERQGGNPLVRRLLRDLAMQIRYVSNKAVVIVAPILEVPLELEKDINVMPLPLPTLGELAELLDETIRLIEASGGEVRLNDNEYEDLVRSAQGLTVVGAERAFINAMMVKATQTGQALLDQAAIEIVLKEKEQVLRGSGALEIFSHSENFGDIGGLQNLKTWAAKRARAFSIEAQDFGLPAPKGVLLIGVPGCGKSLAAKAIAAEWKKPLLRLDMGALFSSRVGSSEKNLREALAAAEAVSPSILWIDEIEKAFSGMNSGGDGGVTARVFGGLLTWMQEKTAPVFVVATANSLGQIRQGSGGLPPELLRKGRFDELFFVDLPNPEERQQIFEVHLRKRRYDPQRFDLVELAENSQGFSGAEIEQAILAAMFDAFAGLNYMQFAAQEAMQRWLDEDNVDLGDQFTEEELNQALNELLIELYTDGARISENTSPAKDALQKFVERSYDLWAAQMEEFMQAVENQSQGDQAPVGLNQQTLLQNLAQAYPLSQVMQNELVALREWAKDHLRPASPTANQPLPKKKTR